METNQLSDSQQEVLAAAATRLHVPCDLALEMAINRLAMSAGLMPEGDLSRVDMSQSLEHRPSGDALSTSLPGFEDR